MKVLFVHTPRFNVVRMPAPAQIYNSVSYPPLGLLYVAASIQRDRPRHEVSLFDYNAGSKTYEDLLPTLMEIRPDVVGMTAYTYTLYDLYRVCELVRQYLPETKIVLGGPHIDVYPDETLRQPFVDFLVKGEGEITFLELLDHFEGVRSIESVRGVYWRNAAGQAQFTGIRTTIGDLDSLAIPDRRLLASKGYRSIVNPNYLETTMITSRGCPFSCNFCDQGGNKYRYRSPRNVVDEMEACQAAGMQFIQFTDDTFNLFPKKVKHLCLEIIERKVQIPWSFRGRVDQVDDEMFELLARANCKRVFFGVESGSDSMLEVIGKRITTAETRRAFALARQHGIETIGYFMMGFPNETEEQIMETINLAKSIGAAYAYVSITLPLPTAPLWQEVTRDPRFPRDYLRNYTLSPSPEFEMLPWSNLFTLRQLYRFNKRFYREFYFRPAYVLQRLRDVKSAVELARKALAGLSLLWYGIKPAPRKIKVHDGAVPPSRPDVSSSIPA